MIVEGLPRVMLWLALHVGCQSTSQGVGFGVITWGNVIEPPRKILLELQDNVTDVFETGTAYAALKAGGEVVTWGSEVNGGDSSAVEAKLRGNVTAIFNNVVYDAGAFAALKAGGEVVTWGSEVNGGNSSAVEAKLRGNVTAIFSNGGAFVALKAGGEVVTWGNSNSDGDSSAVEAKLRGNVTAIFSNPSVFAALKAGGEVVTWGDSSHGGDSSAVEAKLRGNVTAIFSSFAAFAALKAGGEVVTWGYSRWGGDSSAVEAKLRSNVTAIFNSVVGAFAALKAGGEVVTWGDSWSGGEVSSAVEAKLRGNVTAIFSNVGAFAALKAGGEVVTWGDSDRGGFSSAVEAKLRGNVTAIFNGEFAFAALKAGGEVVTWGDSCCSGDSSAVEAKLRGNVTAIFSNGRAFAALKAGGEVVTWGDSNYGGDSSAAEAKLGGNVTAIFSTWNAFGTGVPKNGEAFAALKAGGEVVTWGDSNAGGDSSRLRLHTRVTKLISFQRSFAALICIPHRQSFRSKLTSSCEPCNLDEIWTGVVNQCQKCQREVQVPNTDQTECTTCRTGFIPVSSVCTECSGNTFAEAESTVCQTCEVGKVPAQDRGSCRRCDPEEFAEDGICKSCPSLFNPNEGQTECVPDLSALVVRIIYIIFIAIFVKLLFLIFSLRFKVIDVSLHHGKTILTTLSDHNLSCPPYRPTFPIQLQGTCHPALDVSDSVKPKVARAKVHGMKTLELLDTEGNSLDGRFDTSKGTLLLTYLDAFLHASLLRIPLVLPASVIFLAIIFIAIENLEAEEAGIISSAAVLASSIFCSFMKWRQSHRKTPLEMKLEKFHRWLSSINPKPTSCPKGPGRAIRLDRLLHTHDSFRTFILDRTAYYLDGNILKPLTAKYRLSYAELVGPETVDFFVSHFWGTEFTHFCSSLQKHAQTVARQGRAIAMSQADLEEADPNAQNQQVAYWICFCSNNQYDIHNELGGDIGWRESSFYLALQSPSCQCSCMVVDDKALPLTRSWCIFETLQALQLSQKRSGFDLLMCTASGVLNYGNASIEAAMGVVKGVSRMDLRDAQASCTADKVMIDRLVLEEMGSFEKLNNFIRDEIHVILERAQQTCTSEFQNLFTILETSRQMETSARASISQRRSSSSSSSTHSNEDTGQAFLHTLYGQSLEISKKELEMNKEIEETNKQIEEMNKKTEEMKNQNEERKKQKEAMKKQKEELDMKRAQMGVTKVWI